MAKFQKYVKMCTSHIEYNTHVQIKTHQFATTPRRAHTKVKPEGCVLQANRRKTGSCISQAKRVTGAYNTSTAPMSGKTTKSIRIAHYVRRGCKNIVSA